MYRASSLRTVEEEVSKYKLPLVGVQEVRWDGVGAEQACDYTFFYGKENDCCMAAPSRKLTGFLIILYFSILCIDTSLVHYFRL
jgi:hypothetical protein